MAISRSEDTLMGAFQRHPDGYVLCMMMMMMMMVMILMMMMMIVYPLVGTYIAIEHGRRNNGFCQK